MPRGIGRRELASLDAGNVVDSPRTPRTPRVPTTPAAPRSPRTRRPPPPEVEEVPESPRGRQRSLTPRPTRGSSPAGRRDPSPRPARGSSPARRRDPSPRPTRGPSPARRRNPSPRPARDPSPQPARDPEREIRAAAALQRREQNGRIVNNRFYREDRGEGGRSRSPRSPLRPAAEGRLNLRQRRESRHTAASLGGRAPSLSPMSQDIPLVIDVPDDRHRRQSWEEDFWQRQPAHESRFVNVHRNEGLLNLITIDQTRS